MSIYTPFTYRITCKTTGQHYYGVRYAKDCNPKDLWNTYFTSSKKVHELINQYGKDDFVVEIDKIFSNALDARIYEEKFLRDNDCIKSEIWLNFGNAGSQFNTKMPEFLTDEWKQNIGKSNLGKKRTVESKNKMSIKAKGNKNASKPRSDEFRKKMQGNENGAIRKYLIVHPDGTIELIKNMTKFAKIHKLNSSCLLQVAKGIKDHHKQYKAIYID